MDRKVKKRRNGCLMAAIMWILLIVLMTSGLVIMVGRGIPQKWAAELGKKYNPVPFQETHIAEEEVAHKYFYEQLNSDEKVTYQEILQGIRDYEMKIYIREADTEKIGKIINCIAYDTPEIFWFGGGFRAEKHEETLFEEGHTILTLDYVGTPEEIEARKQEVEAAVVKCLEGAPTDGDYEKIKYVYDYIVQNVEYDMEASDNQNIYSVFVGERSVCAGYSKAFQYLMDRMDISSTYVIGTTTEGNVQSTLGHAWNLVRCDGEYYYIDVTWGDPLFTQDDTKEDARVIEGVYYDYMLCTSEELFRTHKLDESIEMPECTATKDNYYRRNSMYYDMADEQQLLKALNNSLTTKSNPVIFKFSNEATFTEGRDLIFDKLLEVAAQNYMSMQRLNELHYYQLEDTTNCKVVIEWVYK